jgi:hypothetical protein
VDLLVSSLRRSAHLSPSAPRATLQWKSMNESDALRKPPPTLSRLGPKHVPGQPSHFFGWNTRDTNGQVCSRRPRKTYMALGLGKDGARTRRVEGREATLPPGLRRGTFFVSRGAGLRQATAFQANGVPRSRFNDSLVRCSCMRKECTSTAKRLHRKERRDGCVSSGWLLLNGFSLEREGDWSALGLLSAYQGPILGLDAYQNRYTPRVKEY